MWAALVAAIGIGVVWAGGERTQWRAGSVQTPWHEPNVVDGFDFTRSVLFVSGRSGGMNFRHETFDSRSASLPVFAVPVQRWCPTWAGRWPVNCALRIPYWIPMALCLTTFALLFRIERREKRLARAGHCVCGYSLAGLADGAVCPECGTSGH